jgi:hypothetical protein
MAKITFGFAGYSLWALPLKEVVSPARSSHPYVREGFASLSFPTCFSPITGSPWHMKEPAPKLRTWLTMLRYVPQSRAATRPRIYRPLSVNAGWDYLHRKRRFFSLCSRPWISPLRLAWYVLSNDPNLDLQPPFRA